jgi:hypothetical protein
MAKAVFGLDGPKAFDWVRAAIPGAVENLDQMAFIESFSA